MAASRASSFRALNRLSASSGQVRRLHITGPTTFPSPLLTSERPAVNLPKNIAGLRDECQKRALPTVGSKQELIDRISADELIQTRGFSTAITGDQKRPALSESDAFMALPPNNSNQTTRHFNTSRSLKAVKDSSTMDFAYFPDFNPDLEGPAPTLNVPIVPRGVAANHKAAGTASTSSIQEEDFVKPEISTASADFSHISAPSALTGDEPAVDFGKMAETAKKLTTVAEESVGDLRTFWNGLLDDLFGPKSTTSKA